MKKLLGIFTLLLLQFIAQPAHSQHIKTYLTSEFLEAGELYVIQWEDEKDYGKFSSLKVEGFIDLVKENWPEKKIIPIDRKSYNKLKGARKKFFITTVTYHWYRYNNYASAAALPGGSLRTVGRIPHVRPGSMHGILLQKGKMKASANNRIYWMSVDFTGISAGVAEERFNYAVRNLAQMLKHYDDNSQRNAVSYKSEDLKNILAESTLLIRETNLNNRSRSIEKVKKYYPYPVQIVNQQEWEQAIGKKQENILYIDRIGGLKYIAFNIHRADDGKLIYALYPWTSLAVGKHFFKKLLK